ncbi:MAG: hypothetical protein IPL39_19540 [Opitutaceae bacterium]|nr:hypothetical protein [Opitutaceae bacterium]
MTNGGSTSSTPAAPTLPANTTVGASGFRFSLATDADNAELLAFSRTAEMPGALRIAFDRGPDYLESLCVEGRHHEVLLCREAATGVLVATGHRSLKPAFVDGAPLSLGYLGGLHVAPSVRSAQLLTDGYASLGALHELRPAALYLTTIMEANAPAQAVLRSRRLGLPAYHDLGRFCCMAIDGRSGFNAPATNGLSVRRATVADGAALVAFLHREGRTKQFFPEYRVEDFGRPDGLLAHLDWSDVLLAFRRDEIVGTLAAWDQRKLRRWRIAGYVPWLRALRFPLNLLTRLRGMPSLPPPNAPLDYFILSLVCVRDNDRTVFRVLLDAAVRDRSHRVSFFIAGLHERDPLLPELANHPHVPLYSLLYAVAWEDGERALSALDRLRIPYVETGSL